MSRIILVSTLFILFALSGLFYRQKLPERTVLTPAKTETPTTIPSRATISRTIALRDRTLILSPGYADPSVIRMDDGSYLMYVNRQAPGSSGVLLMNSEDAVNWKQMTDIIFPGVAVARAYRFSDGVRYYYHQTTRRPAYPFEPLPTNIVSSLSENGITYWQEEGIVIPSREGYRLSGPSVVQLQDGTYRMFFDEDKVPTSKEQSIQGGIISAASSQDGRTWVRDDQSTIEYEDSVEGSGLRNQSPQVLHPAVIAWPEQGGYLMVYNSHSRLFLAFSKDGYEWEKLGNTGIRGADADIIRLANGSFRVYFGGGCVDISESGCVDPESGIPIASTIHTGILEIKFPTVSN